MVKWLIAHHGGSNFPLCTPHCTWQSVGHTNPQTTLDSGITFSIVGAKDLIELSSERKIYTLADSTARSHAGRVLCTAILLFK